MKSKIILILIFGLTLNLVHSQNKKEQIETLNYSIDSLNSANSNLKTSLVSKDKIIAENQNLFKNNEEKIAELNKNIENSQKTISELNRNISTLNKNNSELISLNGQLKKTIDSLNSLLQSKQIIKYSLRNIEGVGDNCNCGCDAEKQVNGNWEHLGTFACELPKCTGSKIINDYLNSFWIIIDQDKFTFQVENKEAIKGQLLNQPVKNKQSVLYKSVSSNYMFREVNDDDCDPFAILFGTLESITEIELIHEINNTIHLTFNDGGSNYSFLFSIN
jgi:hypothetical protein